MSSSADLKRQKQKVEKELKQYQKRLEELQAIQRDVTTAFTDNISDINNKIDKVISEENRGFHNHTHFLRELGDVLERQTERYVGSDVNMREVSDNLQAENTSVSNKIAQLEQEIRDLNQALAEAEAREREEAKEKLKAALGL